MACTVAKRGKWGPSHKYWLCWTLAAGRRPQRRDRMSTTIFRNKVFRARVRTVLHTAQKQVRTAAQRYSLVDCLVEVVVGKGDVK